MTQLIQLMRSLRSMPPLPDVAARVLAIVRNPEYSIDSLVAVVRTDPALTTRILKLCNSSLFGLSHPLLNVSDAVAYLGTRNLIKLLLVSCTADYFKNLPKNGYADPDTLWRQTLACAIACQSLADACGHDQPATAFTAGILHNLGRIAMVQVIDARTLERAAAELKLPESSLLEVERRVLGLDHAAASGIVAESWNLPVELRRAARNHHDAALLATDDDLTALLHVAEAMVVAMGREGEAAQRCEPHPAALQKLRLPGQALDDVRCAVERELERTAKLLNPEARAGR
jgi:HD-like signal output (HDOD) protein